MPSATEWHRMGAEEVLKALGSSSSGLSGEEARSRLKKHGLNELVRKRGISRLGIFARQFRSFLVLLLLAATVFSLLIGHEVDAAVILVIVVLNAMFGFFQEYKAEKAIEALKRLMAPKALVLRDGKRMQLPAKELVPGDVVLLEEGSSVPVDVRITKSVSLRVDESSLTGESVPVGKQVNAVGDAPVADRTNMAYMGTSVVFGRGEGVVTATGMGTEVGKIATMVESREKETPLQEHLGSFGRALGMMVVAISFVVILGGILRNYNPIDMVMTGIALAVAAVPEGLPAVVTITLALGVQRMSRRRAIVRRLPAVETLGAVDVICSDKTGTLTENQMTVRRVWSDGKMISVTGRGYSPSGDFHVMGRTIKPAHYKGLMMLLRCAALCNNAEVRGGRPAGDPTEAALLVAAEKALDTRKLRVHMVREGEVPFSSARKMMSVVCRPAEKEGLMFTKGAPEILLRKCDRIFLQGRVAKLTKEKRKEILEVNRKLASEALRVLALAYKPAGADEVKATEEEEKELIFLGLAGMIDPPRKEVLPSLQRCQGAGIRVVMVTGDHEETARAIAKELGIFREGDMVVTGKGMESTKDEELKKIIDRVSVFARVSPGHKLRIIRMLKARGHTVAMTGDGVNDAPALKRADIGVAMGIRGTDVAKEASDMVLADDDFRTIVSAVKEGRAIYDNIKKFVQFLLSSNMGEVLVVFLALLIGFHDPSTGGIVLPLTAIQLLWINLLTDGLPAVSLGVDPAARDIMKRPPRGRHEKMLSMPFLTDILFVGVLIAIASLSLFSYGLAAGGAAKAMTLAFTSLVFFELVRVQTVRQKYKMRIFSNRLLLASLAVSLLFQFAVVYIPALQGIFHTVALGLADWLYILAAMGVMVLLVGLKNRYLG